MTSEATTETTSEDPADRWRLDHAAERSAAAARMDGLAAAIAEALNGTEPDHDEHDRHHDHRAGPWQIETSTDPEARYYDTRYLHDTADASTPRIQLDMRPQGRGRGRLVIRATLPMADYAMEQATGCFVHSSITADPSRPAERIVGEIRRRLLPVAAKEVVAFREAAADHAQLESARDRILRRVLDAGGGTEYTRSRGEFHIRAGETYATGTAYSDSVTFDRISTTPEKAERIAAIIGE